MNTNHTAQLFMGYTLFPVLDDDTGALDYWDVHDKDDPKGEGEPLAFGFPTLIDAKQWVRQWAAEEHFINNLLN